MNKEKSHIPLIGKSIWASTPVEFRAQVDSLYISPNAGKPERVEATLSFNKKGNPIIRIKRDPKYILPEEIDRWVTESGKSEREIYIWLGKRDIKVLRIRSKK